MPTPYGAELRQDVIDVARKGMSDPAPRSDRNNSVLRVLAVVFTVAAIGALVLVAVGRPPAGDVFIAALNSVVAAVSWRRLSRARHP